jgi:signal recognition particle GTPase
MKATFEHELVKRMIKEAVKAEREACWDIIFDYAGRDDITPEDESLLKHLADLIRARGQA